jgi:hypothetical protein
VSEVNWLLGKNKNETLTFIVYFVSLGLLQSQILNLQSAIYDCPSARPRVFLRQAQDKLPRRRNVRGPIPPAELFGTRRKRLRGAWHTFLQGLATAICKTFGPDGIPACFLNR